MIFSTSSIQRLKARWQFPVTRRTTNVGPGAWAPVFLGLIVSAASFQACSSSVSTGKKDLGQIAPLNQPLPEPSAGHFLTLAFDTALSTQNLEAQKAIPSGEASGNENGSLSHAGQSLLHDNLIIRIFEASKDTDQAGANPQFEPIVVRRNKELSGGDVITVPGVPRLTGIKASLSFLNRDEELAFCESEVLDLQIARSESVKVPMQCVLRKGPQATVAVIEPKVLVNSVVELALMPDEKQGIERLIEKIAANGVLLSSDVQYATQKARLLLRLTQAAPELFLTRLEIMESPSGVSLASAESTLNRTQVFELFRKRGSLNLAGSWLAYVQNADALSLESRLVNFTLQTKSLYEIVPNTSGPAAGQPESQKPTIGQQAAAYALESELKVNDAKTGAALLAGSAPLELTLFTERLGLEAETNSAAAFLRVASYNVENFWDDIAENSSAALTYDDFSASSSDYFSQAAYLTKAKNIVKALSLAGFPDVVGMQELESAENHGRSLEILKPLLEERGYRYFALGKQTASKPVSVTTGFASRYPIVLNENLVLDFMPEGIDEKTKAELRLSARDPQVVEIEVSQPLSATSIQRARGTFDSAKDQSQTKTRVRIYNSHWKSKRGDSALGEAMRLATARLIKSDIDKVRLERPNLDIIVLGDLNTDYRETNILEIGLGQTGDKRKMLQEQGSESLYNLWFDLRETDRCSYSHSGFRGCIDNIFVSDTLFDKQGLQIVDGSFRIIGRDKGLRADNSTAGKGGLAEHILLGADGTPFSWQIKTVLSKDGTKRMLHVGQGFSDHLPIVADFKVTKNSLPGKLTAEELKPESFSTTQSPPQSELPERVTSCKTDEYTQIDLQNPAGVFHFSLPQNLGKCVRLVSFASGDTVVDSAGKAYNTIERDGLFGVKVRLTDGTAIGLTMTNSYDKNQTFLRANIQNAIGDSLVHFQGRLGWSEGSLSLFAQDPANDVNLKNFEDPCDSLAQASLNLQEVLSQVNVEGQSQSASMSLQQFHGKCVRFDNVEIEVEREAKTQAPSPQNPVAGVAQAPKKAFRVGTLTAIDHFSGTLPKIGLFVTDDQALSGLSQKGRYLVSGYATLIVTSWGQSSTKEFILNTLTNGRSTGQIVSATAIQTEN